MRELQDLYDFHRNFTGEQFYRDEPVPQGRYRLGVQVWVRNDDGKFLLSQRHPCKKKPLLWEATGGAVDAGEDTLTAAVREVGEELGLKLETNQLKLLCTKLCDGIEFLDTYLAEHEVRFTGHLYGRGEALSGQVTGDLSLRMMYYIPVDAVDEVLTAELGSVTFDADAWKAQTSSAAIGAGAELSGIHPVSMTFWQPEEERTGSDDLEIYHATRALDFAGAAYQLNEITFTPTDTVIGLSVTQPDGWSDAERLQHPIQFLFLLDWEGDIPKTCTDEIKKAGTIFLSHGPAGGFQMDDAARAAATEAHEANGWRQFTTWYHNSELTPSQWAQAKTLTIIPYTEYHWEMTVRYDDGPEEPFSLRDGNVHTGIANHTGYTYEEQTSLFSESAVTIQLDDYR